jgi:hypothetical protein
MHVMPMQVPNELKAKSEILGCRPGIQCCMISARPPQVSSKSATRVNFRQLEIHSANNDALPI